MKSFEFIANLILGVCLIKLVSSWPDFYLYTKKLPDGVKLAQNSIEGSTFDKSKLTVIFVHGFQATSFDSDNVRLRQKLVQSTTSNVVMVEWSEAADPSRTKPDNIINFSLYMTKYYNSARSTRIVADVLARFILLNSIDPATVHCIGISLGAHVCGFAGKKVRHLRRITGLDPAGPAFGGNSAKDRLDKSDAQFVDCIMTTDVIGINNPICLKNFYPNGGLQQPKCVPDKSLILGFDFCSHVKAQTYFEASLNLTCVFSSTPCSNYDEFKQEKCNCEGMDCSPMGFFADNNLQSGKFYLNTSEDPPYCNGHKQRIMNPIFS